MAKSLELDVVAEGVESDNQIGWLVKQRVSFVQGYVFSKPLPASQFISFVTRFNS
jgi:sensor c-di-GMP phosphodiesterase-like protein